MRRVYFFSLILIGIALAGCSEETKPGKAAGDGGKTPPSNPGSAAAPAPKATSPAPTTAGGEVPLTPVNTKIEFVGAHVGDKPDPRKGSFTKFNGTAKVDGATLVSVKVDIETESLATEIDKLTNHLKSPDFFDVKQHPTAKFESTAIEPAGDGKVNITGNLTLHNETKSITFPATVSTKDGLLLNSEFQIDRTEFGISFGPDKIEKQVAMTISVGK